MPARRLLILGGYGNTGLPLAWLLLAETDVHLILAGRSLDRAERAAAELNAQFPGGRVTGAWADAADPPSLAQPLTKVDLLVVTASTARHARGVAAAALAAGVDYVDVQYSTAKTAALQSLAEAIERAGLCFITDGGFHPGLPAALVRYAAPHFDRLESAVVGSVIKIDWAGLRLSPETLAEFVLEFRDFQALAYKSGRWQPAGWLAMLTPKFMDFGPPFGRQYGLPMFLEEMRPLPDWYPALRETSFLVGGFNWFADWVASPIIVGTLKLFPERGVAPMARLLRWSLNTFSRPPYGTRLKLEARGTLGGERQAMEVLVAHADGYALTAIPVAACLLQYLDGSARRPGLWRQAHLVEPERFLRDLERLGVEVHIRASAVPAVPAG